MRLAAVYRLSVATVVSTTLTVLASASARAYTFTKIFGEDSMFRVNEICGCYSSPAINNNGVVAFESTIKGTVSLPYYGGDVIFIGSGGAITPISPLYIASYGGESGLAGEYLGSFDINDRNTVVFWEITGSPRQGYPPQEIFTVNNGVSTVIAETADHLGIFGDIAINNNDTVPFISFYKYNDGTNGYSYGLFTSNSGTRTLIGDGRSPFREDLYTFSQIKFAINNQDTVVFTADLDTGDSGIFTSNGNTLTTITKTSGPYSFYKFGTPAINDEGAVAFKAPLDAGGYGVFTSDSGVITTVADTQGPFSGFENIALNNEGTVAFTASLKGGGEGIFTGADPISDKVIALGDQLFGSTVSSLSFSYKGFNNAGQIAFAAGFTDGTTGIFRADPELKPAKSVPEPASVLGLLAVGALGIIQRHKR